MTSGLPIWTPYCGVGATPADLLVRWNSHPMLVAGFALGLVVVWRQSAGPRAWMALILAALLFLSPVCALSSALFAARTVHHVLLVAALAPLIAWTLPQRASHLAAATACSTLVFWAWHAPDAYEWAMSHDAAYWLMQGTLLGAAIWFWAAVRGAATLAAIAALLASTVQMGLLGALLTIADRTLYAPHAATTLAWGLTAMQDQQIAGLIMWAPAAAVYMAVAMRLLARRLQPEPALS